MSNFQLLLELEKNHNSTKRYQIALDELERRKQKEHDQDQGTQKKIKRIALWTLLVGCAVLVITIAQFLYVTIVQPDTPQQPKNLPIPKQSDTVSALQNDTNVTKK